MSNEVQGLNFFMGVSEAIYGYFIPILSLPYQQSL